MAAGLGSLGDDRLGAGSLGGAGLGNGGGGGEPANAALFQRVDLIGAEKTHDGRGNRRCGLEDCVELRVEIHCQRAIGRGGGLGAEAGQKARLRGLKARIAAGRSIRHPEVDLECARRLLAKPRRPVGDC